MCWLRRAYPPEVLADFLRRKGSRLAPRELAYWAVIAGIQVPIPAGGGRPSWAGSRAPSLASLVAPLRRR